MSLAAHRTDALHRALAAIATDGSAFAARFFTELWVTYPTSRSLFPLDPAPLHELFCTQLTAGLQLLDPVPSLDQATLPGASGEFFFRQGAALRKCLIPTDLWDTAATALATAATPLLRTDSAALAIFTQASRLIARTMAAGATTEQHYLVPDPSGEFVERPAPPRVGATVVDVDRRTRRIAVIRLISDAPMGYRAGQSLSVLAPQAHGHWRRYSPSIPPNPDGMLEFHIAADDQGLVSPGLVHSTQPGDRWVLADPQGELTLPEDDRDLLLIAGGTGLAPLRCLLLQRIGQLTHPRVHFFVGARFPGELYDAATLWQLAGVTPWLIVQPVAESPTDDWTVRATHARAGRGLNTLLTGRVDEVVTRFGSWADRHVLIAGPDAMVTATRDALIARGCPAAQIHTTVS